MPELPFIIKVRMANRNVGIFSAEIDGEPITSERYTIGNGDRRRIVGELLAADARLKNGSPILVDDVVRALERAEHAAMAALDRRDAEVEAMAASASLAEQGRPDGDGPKKSQATLLVEFSADAALWHSPDREPWATVEVEGHREHHHVQTKGFRRWLADRFFKVEGKAPRSASLQEALDTIAGQAVFSGSQHSVYVRIADHDGDIYLDLADEGWRSAQITKDGWIIVDDCPVKFRRPAGVEALPIPERGGKLDELRRFVNVRDDDAFILLVAFLVQALRPTGPYPVLAASGEQGSAKTTLCRMIRALIDPNAAALRTEPRQEQDLMIAASNGWIVGFDNLSFIPNWLSDALCRLSTGGGFGCRKLYTDGEENLFTGQRPVIANGIEDLAARSDLMDRRIGIVLSAIPEEDRRTESELWSRFYAARPRILGAMLDAAVVGLGRINDVKLARLPRMADFATWITACEPALPWPAGAFMRAYDANRADAHELVLESNPVAAVLRSWLSRQATWTGTASELLRELDREAGEDVRSRKGWPTQPNKLSGVLRRLTPNLKAVGIAFDVDASKRPKTITFSSDNGRGDDGSARNDDQRAPVSSYQNRLFDPVKGTPDDHDDHVDEMQTFYAPVSEVPF